MTKYLETKNNSIEEAISSVVLGEAKLDEYTLTKLDKMRGIKKGDHVFFVSGSNAEGNVYAQNEKEAIEKAKKKGIKGKISVRDKGEYKGQPRLVNSVNEGYESEVLKVLKDADIEGYFKNNKLYVSRRDARDAKKALDDSDEITKLPKMVMEDERMKKLTPRQRQALARVQAKPKSQVSLPKMPDFMKLKKEENEMDIVDTIRNVVEKKLDPVNPKAVKKKFDDRKDKDIDNDGDVDSSDEYLHKRRKAISKAIKNERVSDVDVDQAKRDLKHAKIQKKISDVKKEETVLEASQHPDHSKNMKAAAEYHGHMAAHHHQSQNHHDDKSAHHDDEHASHSDAGNKVGADHHETMADRHIDKHDDHETARKAHDLAHKAAKKGDIGAYKKHMNAARKASDAAHKPRGSDRNKVSTRPTSHLSKAGHSGITSGGHMTSKSTKKPSGPAAPADRRNPTGAMVGVRENILDKNAQMMKSLRMRAKAAKESGNQGLFLSLKKQIVDLQKDMMREAPKREAYEIGNDYAKHTLRVTPGQTDNDVDEMIGVMQKKSTSMRETLAKMWGMNEGKNPFEKKDLTKETKDGKTMTGQKPTTVKVNPKIEEK